ncbi:MAG TPA: elongation factor G [Chloroflexia bacterium]|nr:elongation factor G [Chloroflexia bacterium]
MRAYTTEAIRNVGLFSHGGAGKTSLVEALLFNAKATSRLGRVEEGNTISDFDPDEAKRHMSLQIALAPVEWRDHKINLVDTPGYAEFQGELKAAMRVVDGALIVLDAVGGVEVGAEQAWNLAHQAGVAARLLFINRMDRENADFLKTVWQAREMFGKGVTPLHLPIGSQQNFRGVVDVLHGKAYLYKGLGGDGQFAEAPIPADMETAVKTFREELIERAAETEDDLTMKYLEGEALTDDEITHGVLTGIKSGQIIPAFCGSATCNVGIGQLLDALITYVPSPADCDAVKVTRPGSSDTTELAVSAGSPLTALVFKTQVDRYGTLSLFRVYTGVLHSDSTVHNCTKNRDERVGQLMMLKGKEQQPVPEVVAGDIGAVAKLTDTAAGDTLAAVGQPFVLDGIAFPKPVFAASIVPRTKGDLDKLGPALAQLTAEDPTLQTSKDPLSGETILSGMGENHVHIAAERMQRKSGVAVDVGLPHIPYRETIKRKVPHSLYRHKKQTGGHGQFAEVVIELEPLTEGEFEFGERVVGGSVPKNFIPAVEKGVREALSEGVLAGYPVVNLRVVLIDGKFHPVDSSEMAFKIASSQAFKEGAQQGQPILLEPIYTLHVTVPDRFSGDIMSDMNSKRARVMGMTPQGDGTTLIEAQAPLAEVQRYVSDLRALTQGRGTFTMEFGHYEEVPAHIAPGVIEAAHAAHAAKGDSAHHG